VAGAAYIGSQAFEERKAEQQKLAKLDAKVKAVVAEASRLNAQSSRISAQLSTLQEALRPQFPVLDVMQAASDHAPRGVWLTGLVYEKGKPLVLRGTALSHSLAAEYADDLKRSVCFLQVVPGDSNEVSIGKNKVVQFSITGVVKGNEPKPKRTTKSGSRRLRATE
jgi:Tfp pilus assembly protein PilN